MNITLIGPGRVGTALAIAFSDSGHRMLKIISRTPEKASMLADIVKCEYGTEHRIPPESDVVIISVNDDSLTSVLDKIDVPPGTIVAHTAGSVGLNVFNEQFTHHGVFYPLQTFTMGREFDFGSIPLFVEANNEKTLEKLESLAATVSNNIHHIDSDKRRYLHLAAVFSCNFVNHMYYAGKEIAEKAGMNFDVMIPLITETLEKASDMGPEKSQTGPAIRNDKKTIEKHLDLLSFSPDLQGMYREISGAIINKYRGVSHE